MKLIKKIVVVVCISLIAIASYVYYKNEQMVPILGYHGILPSNLNSGNNELIINTETFEEQLKTLKKLNYKTLSLDEYYCWKIGKCKKPHRSVLITFDDGYMNNYDYAFPLLKKYNMKAVVFYIGSNYKNKGAFIDLETMEKSKKEYPNIEFASHTFNKHQIPAKTYAEVNDDIKQNKTIFDSDYFAYPHGYYNSEYIKALKDNGYKMAFTFGPGKEHRRSSYKDNNYTIPRLNINKNIPIWKFIIRILFPI